MFTFRVRVPLFVMRELHRHRIASYNEESGRYSVFEGLFYVPAEDRALTQVGKPGAYTFEPGDSEQVYATQQVIKECSASAWHCYNVLIDEAGIAKEVARMVLPVNIYSACYVTMNPRALMNFLSLRVSDERSTFPSFPMKEIERLAKKMEVAFFGAMPLTYDAFASNGRVAP
jgi:thymidylate synthase (FAD)